MGAQLRAKLVSARAYSRARAAARRHFERARACRRRPSSSRSAIPPATPLPRRLNEGLGFRV